MPPKSDPAASSASKTPGSSDLKVPKAPAPTAVGGGVVSNSVSDLPPIFHGEMSHPSDAMTRSSIEAMLERVLQPMLSAIQPLVQKVATLEAKIEAQSFAEFEYLRSPPAGHDAVQGRLSLGSNRTGLSSQNSQVGKSSFRLEKPKFEYPKDPKVDGALDESVMKFIDECESHIVIWKTLPENKEKVFEGSENFALVSLPTSVQRSLAHSMDFAYSRGDLVTMTEEESAHVTWWSTAKTESVKKILLVRQAQHQSILAAIKTIQSPEISYPKDTGFIHLQSFQDYKTRFLTQVSRLAEGGVIIPVVSIKDAIISAIPDLTFRAELYAVFGHAGSLPGPDMSGRTEEISIRGIFGYIHKHIIVIKQKGLASVVNRQSTTSTPPTARKFMRNSSFSKVHAIDHSRSEFPESDRVFWSKSDTAETNFSAEAEDSDEFHQVNAVIQKAKSKECNHQGIGPDGKVLCPYLGNPATAKCGFIHPSNELALKGKGVSTSKKVQQIVGLSAGLGISHSEDEDNADAHNEL
jgi:hypothetical protein